MEIRRLAGPLNLQHSRPIDAQHTLLVNLDPCRRTKKGMLPPPADTRANQAVLSMADTVYHFTSFHKQRYSITFAPQVCRVCCRLGSCGYRS
jgi:hypothetical protein